MTSQDLVRIAEACAASPDARTRELAAEIAALGRPDAAVRWVAGLRIPGTREPLTTTQLVYVIAKISIALARTQVGFPNWADAVDRIRGLVERNVWSAQGAPRGDGR